MAKDELKMIILSDATWNRKEILNKINILA